MAVTFAFRRAIEGVVRAWLANVVQTLKGLNVGSATGAVAGDGFFSGGVKILGALPGGENALAVTNMRLGVVGGLGRILFEDAGSGLWSIDNSSGSLRFFVPGSVKMFITSAGHVAIGTVTDGGYMFQVVVDASNEGHVDSTGAWARSSDARLKQDIIDLGPSLAKVLALRPVRYRSANDITGKQQVGLIAQEVQAIVPEVVESDSRGTLGVAYGSLVPLLIAAIQEQQIEIEALKAKLG